MHYYQFRNMIGKSIAIVSAGYYRTLRLSGHGYMLIMSLIILLL